MSTEVQVDVQIASEADSVPQLEDINDWIAAAIAEVGPDSACEVSVRIVDEEEGRSLNREYCNKDYAKPCTDRGKEWISEDADRSKVLKVHLARNNADAFCRRLRMSRTKA